MPALIVSAQRLQAQRLEADLRQVRGQAAAAEGEARQALHAEQARAAEAAREADVMRAGVGQDRDEALQALKVRLVQALSPEGRHGRFQTQLYMPAEPTARGLLPGCRGCAA